MPLFKTDEKHSAETLDKLNSQDANRISQGFMDAVNKVVSVQSSVIIGYVDKLKKRNKNASTAELQKLIDKHYLNIVSGTGAAAGASSAIPGIGLISGAAAIGAESLVFLEASAWYILASSHLRGDDIREKEHRRTLVPVSYTHLTLPTICSV